MKTYIIPLLLSLTLLISGCSSNDTSGDIAEEIAGTSIVFTDDINREVSISKTDRVVSLIGSLSEIWLLAGGELAGVTEDALDERDLDFGDDVINLGAMKSADTELLLEIDPDFVILSSEIAEHISLKGFLDAASIPSAFFDVQTFEDYLEVLKIFTDMTNREDLYISNGVNIQSEIDAAIERSVGQDSPSVLFIRAFSTGAKAKGDDNMTGAMLADLGADNIVERHSSLLEDLSIEEIILADPEYIFVTTMGSSSEKAMQSLADSITSNPAWAELSAVKNDKYILLSQELFHNKPNNRWGESYTTLADILYPDITQ